MPLMGEESIIYDFVKIMTIASLWMGEYGEICIIVSINLGYFLKKAGR